MSTEDDTMDGLLDAIGQGTEPPGDAEEATSAILDRLGIDGTRPIPQPPGATRAKGREIPAPSWGLAAMLLLGIALGVVAAVLALRPVLAPDETAARGGAEPATAPLVVVHGPLEPALTEGEAENENENEVENENDHENENENENDHENDHENENENENEVENENAVTGAGASPARLTGPVRDSSGAAPSAEVERDADRVAVLAPSAPTPTPAAARERSTEGLVRHGDAGLTIRGKAAVLRSGLVTFVRNDEVRPTVEHVRFATVPARALPVGTVFTSGAARGVGAISVQEGLVFLVADSGNPLAEVRPGEAVAVVHDPEQGLTTVRLDGMPLDEIVAEIPEGSEARAAEVRSLVAQLRLAPVSGEALQTLLEFGAEDME